MKQILYFALSLLVIACGSDVNGLKKPITEELSATEIRAILKKYPHFEDTYKLYRGLALWISEDNLRLAKYGTTTYQQLEDYQNCGYDKNKAEAEYNELFPNKAELYKQADSIINHYRSIQPDSLLSLSFKSKGITGGFLSTSVFNITATPKKGEVEQFDFEYYFSPKIDGGKIEDVPASLLRRGYQTKPITKETTISARGAWYGDSFDDKSTDEIIRDYDFLYRITNVRYKGENWLDLPYLVRLIILKNEPITETALVDIIKEMIEPDFVEFILFYAQKSSEVSKARYPELAKMFDEFYDSNGIDYISL